MVKAIFLKNGYAVNKPVDVKKFNSVMIELDTINVKDLEPTNTFTLDPLLSNLNGILKLKDWKTIERGLKILKVFRNKEGHVAVNSHQYDESNYRDVKIAVKSLYLNGFAEQLEFKIFMKKTDKGKLKIN